MSRIPRRGVWWINKQKKIRINYYQRNLLILFFILVLFFDVHTYLEVKHLNKEPYSNLNLTILPTLYSALFLK